MEDVTLDILVAEDKKADLEMTIDAINLIAQKVGFMPRIGATDNVKGAIKMGIESDYDVVLADYNFCHSGTDKNGTGFDILREIKKAKPSQAIYIFSGEGWWVQMRAKYILGVPFVKKIWFEREKRMLFPRKQPKDVHTYKQLERVLRKHYEIKRGVPLDEVHKYLPQTLW